MADQTDEDDAALVAALLTYLRSLHQEAEAIVVALETKRARMGRRRRAADPSPGPAAPTLL